MEYKIKEMNQNTFFCFVAFEALAQIRGLLFYVGINNKFKSLNLNLTKNVYNKVETLSTSLSTILKNEIYKTL